MRVGRSWQLSYDIRGDLIRRRPAGGLGDGTAALEILDTEMEAAYARINKITGDIVGMRTELRDEIQRETRQGWQLILAGLAWSAAGTIVGIWA